VIRLRFARRFVIPALLALLGLSFLPEAKGHASTYLFVVPAIAVLSLCVIENAISRHPSGLLNNRALLYLGKVSYAAYLWDYPLALWFPGPASIPLAVAAASASFWLVERPFLRLKRRSPHQPASRAGVDRDRSRAALTPAPAVAAVAHQAAPAKATP
jgi:peptidoglycan/LPS O-acetylase OafA/YrhL